MCTSRAPAAEIKTVQHLRTRCWPVCIKLCGLKFPTHPPCVTHPSPAGGFEFFCLARNAGRRRPRIGAENPDLRGPPARHAHVWCLWRRWPYGLLLKPKRLVPLDSFIGSWSGLWHRADLVPCVFSQGDIWARGDPPPTSVLSRQGLEKEDATVQFGMQKNEKVVRYKVVV